jgi:hypothetical protein
MIDNMQKTLEQYPHSKINNARQIVRSELIKMKEKPSSAQAQKLEDMFGIVCDFSDKDWGEPPYKNN